MTRFIEVKALDIHQSLCVCVCVCEGEVPPHLHYIDDYCCSYEGREGWGLSDGTERHDMFPTETPAD
jgi:hypothetical protein